MGCFGDPKKKSKKSRYKEEVQLVKKESEDKKEIHNLKARIAELEENIGQYDEERKHEREHNKLKDQLEEKRQETCYLKIQLENANKDLDTERIQRKLADSEKASLSEELEYIRKKGFDKQKQLEEDIKKYRNELEELRKLYETALAERDRLKDLETKSKDNEHRLEDIIEDLRRKLHKSEQAKEECLTRLSAATAAKVLDNNLKKPDLNDPNRPQKLADDYNLLFDDEWTDATEALEAIGKNDEEVIKILLDLLIETYKYCKEVGETQLNRVEENIVLPPLDNAAPNIPDAKDTAQFKSPASSKQGISKLEGVQISEIPVEIRKGIKEYRKKVAKQVLPLIEAEVLTKFKASNQFEDDVLDACKNYIKRCLELCWLMRVQDPPVTLSWSVPNNRAFQDEFYRAYTKTGKLVEYVVWPSMHLHENGPLLVKGVAQGTKP